MQPSTESPPATWSGLSVVVPALNLQGIIGQTIDVLHSELTDLGVPIEIIIVDDGSSDDTPTAVATAAAKISGVRLLRNRRNLGKAASVHTGILAARHSHVIFTDGDLPFTSGCYRRVALTLSRGERVVIASRRLPESQIHVRMDVLGYAARRHFVGVSFNRLVRLLLRLPFSDTQCGLKGFERRTALMLFDRVRLGGFLFDVEILLAARAERISVAEVPVGVDYRDDKSSVQIASSALRVLRGIGSIYLAQRRGLYARPPISAPREPHTWATEVPLGNEGDASLQSVPRPATT